jgi:hypothetical protein
MRTLTKIAVSLSAVASLGAFACSRSGDRGASEPGRTSAQTYAEDAALDAQADAKARSTKKVLEEPADTGNEDETPGDEESELRPASRVSIPRAIAEARCAREQRCGNIGADEKYSSAGACVESVRTDWKEDLAARECRNGVDPSELRECLSAIRDEDCKNPFETLARVSACSITEICEEDAETR